MCSTLDDVLRKLMTWRDKIDRFAKDSTFH